MPKPAPTPRTAPRAVCALFCAILTASCPNTLLEKAKRTQEVASSPRIAVTREGIEVESGGAVDLGDFTPGGAAASLTLTLRNAGAAELLIDIAGLAITPDPGAGEELFSLAAAPADRLAAGDSTTLTIRFSTLSLGAKTATLAIPTNDVTLPASPPC